MGPKCVCVYKYDSSMRLNNPSQTRVSGKHFPGPDFPLRKWKMLTYFIYFAQFEGQHFPLNNFIKKGKVNLLFDLTLFSINFVIETLG